MSINILPEDTLTPATITITATTSDQTVVSAPAAGVSIYVMGIQISNTSSTAVRVDIKEGSTTKKSMMLAGNGGGAVIMFAKPWKLTAATALNAATASSVTDVRVNADYYTR